MATGTASGAATVGSPLRRRLLVTAAPATHPVMPTNAGIHVYPPFTSLTGGGISGVGG